MTAHDALAQIAEIRQRMAWSVTFRGYRASTTAVSAVIALLASLIQSWLQPVSGVNVYLYLTVWFSAALAGLCIVAAGWALRRGESPPLGGELTIAAVECFLPCIVAGVIVTYAIVFHHSLAMIGLLPGLWMLLFSLGIFASRRLLPRAVFVIAGYYMGCGLICLTLHPMQALSPWTMGIVFGAGQALAAAILYWTLERPLANGVEP